MSDLVFYLGDLWLDHRTGYLLIALGLAEGSPESGFRWTGKGSEWATNIIAAATNERVATEAEHAPSDSSPTL